MNWFTRRRLLRWAGIALHVVGFPAFHALIPWALSLLGTRHGWAAGRPALANFVGLIPVTVGFFIWFLCSHEHLLASQDGWVLERTPHFPTPSYLLTTGPYRYSCHPIYLAEGVIWFGWMIFYGSFVVAGVFATMALLLGPLILPREERGLETRFGDAYREFRRTTPRWLGKPRR